MSMRSASVGVLLAAGAKVAPGSLLLGAAAWSAAEYAIHRFVGHGPRRHRATGLAMLTPSGLLAEFNAEHIAHHADPMYFAPTSRKMLAAGVALVAMGAVGSALVGPRRGVSFAAGFAGAYLGYEAAHRRVHTHAPRGSVGRWRRRHHLFHHHRSPRTNHGVTSPLFDVLFSTNETAGVVKVPAWVAPAWLIDKATRAVRPEFAADYELVHPKKARAGGASKAESLVVG